MLNEDHIKHVLDTIGEYEGTNMKLVKIKSSERFPYRIVHYSKRWGTDSELYINVNEAIYDFVALEKKYGKGEKNG